MNNQPESGKKDPQSSAPTQNFELAPIKAEHNEASQSSPVYVDAGSHPINSSSESRGVGARFIAGFAAAGLLAAGAVGVWTLQTTNNSAQARQESVAEQSQVSELSGGASSGDAQPADPRDNASGTREPSMPGNSSHSHTTGRNGSSSALENDPFLPPNSWNGQAQPNQPAPYDSAPSGAQNSSVDTAPSVQTPSTPKRSDSWTENPALPSDPDGIFDEITPGTSKTSTEPQPSETLTELPTSTPATTQPSSTGGSSSPSTASTSGAESTDTSTPSRTDSSAPTTDTTGQ